ncbi:methyltransferase family protein [Labedaea rhizosphaerae]|uniref:Methyltransferase family protein n=1 Tax=Labedaea rhizosphaerae TaxID=598644 RepID=A0A4R6SFU4_LABRH|nr:methyltransferase family protein [Labedaea rhizosphaerae]
MQDAWQQMATARVGELAASYVLCTAVVGLARAGVARRLSRDWTELAALVPAGGSESLLRGVLEFLAVRGLLEREGDAWRTTDRGAALLAELPESLLGYYVEAYGPVLHGIDAMLTGRQRYGVDVERDTEALGRRCEVLFRSFGSDLVRRLMREHGAHSVLDLGCGTGGLVLDLCRDDPAMSGVGLDIATDAIDFAAERARAEGLADRASFVVGDAFQPQTWPAAAVDTDFVVAVGALHEHFRDGEGAVVELLGRYAELLTAGKVFLLCEPEMFADEKDADFFLVHVLTDQGFPRPLDQWLEVIGKAGLRCDRVFSAPNTGFRFAYYEITAG